MPDTGSRAVWRRGGVLISALRDSVSDRMSLAAAGCAFYATLAVVPSITTLISVYGLALDRQAAAQQLQLLKGLVPDPAFALIAAQVHVLTEQPPTRLSTGLIVSLLLTLWSASTGTKSVLSALNVVHNVTEERGVMRFQITGLALTLAALLVAAMGIAVVVFIPAIVNFVGLARYVGGLLRLASMSMLVGLFSVSLVVFYRIGPSRVPPPHQPILPGVLLATLLWMAVSVLLSWYITHIASFGVTYGPLGAVAGVMFWFYGSAYAVLLGAELNAHLETGTIARQRHRHDSGVGGC